MDLTARRMDDPDNVDLPALLQEIGADRGQIVGSAAIFGHGQDIDVAVEGLHLFDSAVRAGFVYDCEKVYSGSAFASLRRGSVNLLLCTPPRYATFVAATAAARVLAAEGLITYDMKATRVALYENVHGLF